LDILRAAALFAIAFVSVESLCLSQTAPPSPGSAAAALQPFVDAHSIAGAVTLVASKDKVLDLETVGYADIAGQKAMKPDDLFWIASMSKPMTATALMILVDEGKVNVEDPVEKYLPEFQGQMVAVEKDAVHVLLKKPVHPILVRNVLSHTSGLPFLSRVIHHIDQFPLSEAVVTYAMSPLNFEPFTKYQYANAGIDTAGRIVEVVSGMPYEQFMAKRLFEPLGMKDTTFFPSDDQLARLARSYKLNADKSALEELPIEQLTYPLTRHDRYPSPAGGLFSTAADCGRFCQMILNGGTFEGKRYLSEAAVRQMTSTQTGDLQNKGHGEGGYGFGFSTTRMAHGEAGSVPVAECGHGGAYATNMSIDPEHGLVLVFMIQHAGPMPKGHDNPLGAFHKAAMDAFAPAAK
jgi:CubicO group peptidase (beta-lactamase class C family)